MARVRDHLIYQGGDVLLLRAAARPLDSALAPWPDPADSGQLRAWLVKAWRDPVLREAVACASPPLALRADRIAAGRDVPARQVRPAAVALARYQLRAAGRPTPFGLFAGVARARLGDSALARFGEEHRAAARCDAAWLLSVIERCAGCDHFRTDVSYLPDLTAYLDDLLRTCERLAAAIDGVDDWARADATPAGEEITRIRRLISRIKGDIAQLPAAGRAGIDEAVAVIRKHRAVSLGMPSARPPTPGHQAVP